jgi:hypothetical protein
MCDLILSQFLMGTYFLEMNKWCFNWHMPFNCEEAEFGPTHNSLLWTGFVHPFFHMFLFFIHSILQVTIMFLDIKGLKDWIQMKTCWNGTKNVWSHTISILNGNIPFGNEQVVFQLTHNFWLWKCNVWIDT